MEWSETPMSGPLTEPGPEDYEPGQEPAGRLGVLLLLVSYCWVLAIVGYLIVRATW